MTEIGEPSRRAAPSKVKDVEREKPQSKNDLHFAIRLYTNYGNFCWTPFHDPDPDKYGEVDDELPCFGDRGTAVAMQDGFVYVFKGSGLFQAYAVKEGLYQRVKVTPSDDSHTAHVGPARPYMVIEDFFPPNDGDFSEDHYVLASPFKLAKQRLFEGPRALAKDPRPRATLMRVSRRRVREAERDQRTGPQILDDYRRHKPSPDLVTYDYRRAVLGGADGFYLFVPDAAAEARRRARRFQERLARYQGWFHADERNREVCLAEAVTGILEQDPAKKRYVNEAALEQWRREDAEAFRRHWFPVHYAVESLSKWLASPLFQEVLRDHSLGSDDDQIAGVELYSEAIERLYEVEAGAKYLGKQYDDSQSYFQGTTRFFEIKSGSSTPGAAESAFAMLRKWSNAAYALMENFAAVVAEREGKAAVSMIVLLVQRRSAIRLRTVEMRILEYTAQVVTLIDWEGSPELMKRLGEFPETKSGRGIVGLFEAANLAFAFVALVNADALEQRAKGAVNVAGSAIDILGSNLFKTYVARFERRVPLRASAGWAARGLIAASGIIDCLLALWEIKLAYARGEYEVIYGWGVVAIGGAVIAAGALALKGGATVSVGSGGAAVPLGSAMVIGGLILEGVGYLWVWLASSDEVEGWLTRSMFGRDPAGRTAQKQLDDLNEILCRFEVEADFVDTDMGHENYTGVTLKIKPRMITDRSTITLSRVQGYSEARLLELFGNRNDWRVGASGWGGTELRLWEVDPKDVTRKNGRITEVRVHLSFRMDTDEVRGTAELDLNGGTLKGLKREFSVKA